MPSPAARRADAHAEVTVAVVLAASVPSGNTIVGPLAPSGSATKAPLTRAVPFTNTKPRGRTSVRFTAATAAAAAFLTSTA